MKNLKFWIRENEYSRKNFLPHWGIVLFFLILRIFDYVFFIFSNSTGVSPLLDLLPEITSGGVIGIFTIWATLYIPLLIFLYSKDKRSFELAIIEERFKVTKRVIEFIILVVLGLPYSESSPSKLYIFCAIIYLFFRVGCVYYKLIIHLLSKTDRDDGVFFRKIFEQYKKDQFKDKESYHKVRSKIEKWIKDEQLGIDKDAIKKEDGYHPIFIKREPIKVKIEGLDEWIKTFEEKNALSKNTKDVAENSSDKALQPLKANVQDGQISRRPQSQKPGKDFYISISEIYPPLTFHIHCNKKNLELCEGDLERCFSFPPEISVLDEFRVYLKNIDALLLEHIEGFHFNQFQKEIQRIQSIIESLKGEGREKDDSSLQNEILKEIIDKIHNLIENTDKIKEYRLCKDLLFNLWFTLFKFKVSACVNKNSDSSYFLFDFLSASFQKGIFYESEREYIEQRLTSILKYENPTETFLMDYIRALARLAHKSYSKDSEDHFVKDLDMFFIKLIHNLKKDIKNKRISKVKPRFNESDFKEDIENQHISKDNKDPYNEVLVCCRQALMFLGSLYIYNEREKKFKEICKYIDVPSFLSTLSSLFNNIDTYWCHSLSIWRDVHFNRHGISDARWFSSVDFYKKFIFKFFSREGISYDIKVEADCRGLEPSQLRELQIPFAEVQKKFESSEEKPKGYSVVKKSEEQPKGYEVVEKIVNNLSSLAEKKIIEPDLSPEKIAQFINKIKEGYDKHTTFSELLGFETAEMDKKKFYGINEAYPREYFLKVEQSVSGLDDKGRDFAYFENEKIFKEIKSQCKFKDVRIDIFSKDILPKWIKEKGLIITNDSDKEYRIFSYNGSCQNNPDISKENVDGAYGKYFLLKQNGQQKEVHLLAWNPRQRPCFYMFVREGSGLQIERRVKDIDVEERQEKSTQNVDAKKTEREVFKNWKDLFVYKINDLANDKNLREEIINGEEYFKGSGIKKDNQDRHLRLHVGLQLYIAPSLTKIEKPSQIEIYFLT